MRGASKITLAAGGLLVAAAWIAGSFPSSGELGAIASILAEVAAVPVVLLAWRYRRHRMAVAGLAIAAANLVLRTGLVTAAESTAWAALAVALALDLALVTLLRDRPVWRPASLVWAAAIAIQIWCVVSGVGLVGGRAAELLRHDWVVPGAFAGAATVVTVAFLLRRGPFEASLLWTVVAVGAAMLVHRGSQPTGLLLAAGQLSLLVGLVEDSYRLAFHDQLTGLPGRRALDDAMRDLAGTFTIAMADIDHFKRFNDQHGHDAGDQVLRMVADELARTGGGGRAYRYGGEEFAIVFPGAAAADVRGDLEELRRSVADRTFTLRGPDRPRRKPEAPLKRSRPTKTVTVTVSIGLASTSSRRTGPVAVIRAADRALYRAKRAGRNRVVAAGDRLPKRR